MERQEHWLDMSCTGCGLHREDLVRLVVGMQWREMIQSVCVINDNGFGALDGGVDDRVEVTPGFDEVHGSASTIVDEWLGVQK